MQQYSLKDNEIYALFLKALTFVLKWEGGYVNNPNDKGGATNFGITQNTYNNWRKTKNLKPQDVKKITYDEVRCIYYSYWIQAGCNNMTPKFAILAFDTAVNMGFNRVQEFLKAANWSDPDKFIEARRAKYFEFAKYGNQKIFLRGWINRLNSLKEFIKTI